jgi:hypothetical protein
MINLRLSFQTFGLLLSFCLAVPASAQVGGMNGPVNSPTFSPYINLLREGGGVGQNYFGLVRPQVDFAQQNQMLGQNVNALQANQMQQGRMVGGYGYTQLGATGHPVMFGSINGGRFQGGYNGVAGGGGFGGGGGGGMVGGMQGGFGGGAMGGPSMGGFGGDAGAMGGGFGGGGGAVNGGFNPMGAMQFNGPGGAGNGFSGVSGHMAQFGGIGNQYLGAGQGR